MNKIKMAGKWFGIILVGIILLALVVRTVLNIVFGIQLRNTVRQLKAQGRHVTIDQIRPAPVPESENAVILLNQAFTLMTMGERGKPYTPNQDERKNNKIVSKIESVKSFSDISKWTSEEKVEIPKLVYSQDMRKIYGLIEEASRRPKCNFNVKYEEGYEVHLPHLEKMRSAIRLLAVKSMIEVQSGNLDGALNTLNTGVRVSNLLREEPLVISKLVMGACDIIMIDCLQGVTKSKNIPQDKANLIISELSKHTYTNFFDGEMVMALQTFNERYVSSILSSEMRYFGRIGVRIGVWFWAPVFKKELAVYFTLISKLEDRVNEPYYRLAEEKNLPTEEWLKQIPKYCVLSRMTLPAFLPAFAWIGRNQAYLDVCRTGLALKVYKKERGYYPDSLDKLKPEIMQEIPLDPFTGKDYIYRKKDKGFIVYSIGDNLKDDGGIPQFYETEGGRKSRVDFDIIWEE